MTSNSQPEWSQYLDALLHEGSPISSKLDNIAHFVPFAGITSVTWAGHIIARTLFVLLHPTSRATLAQNQLPLVHLSTWVLTHMYGQRLFSIIRDTSPAAASFLGPMLGHRDYRVAREVVRLFESIRIMRGDGQQMRIDPLDRLVQQASYVTQQTLFYSPADPISTAATLQGSTFPHIHLLLVDSFLITTHQTAANDVPKQLYSFYDVFNSSIRGFKGLKIFEPGPAVADKEPRDLEDYFVGSTEKMILKMAVWHDCGCGLRGTVHDGMNKEVAATLN
ncbi:hypothetical protein M501DRAFT_1032639 [Patellaria atrata CBS 101060]|uniref:Uncharacterized protein n=1 Tax=Patellaria atrata CBS 101060 TaxID=1346257 RepID=A0A9P4S780_9PEZI|nr:hypothetical protein M501DRAFT_1032639 [Patellaria atrata CBS 101060]